MSHEKDNWTLNYGRITELEWGFKKKDQRTTLGKPWKRGGAHHSYRKAQVSQTE